MEKFKQIKGYVSQLGLSGNDIYNVLSVIQYAKVNGVEFYQKPNKSLGMRLIAKQVDQKTMNNLTGKNFPDFFKDLLKK